MYEHNFDISLFVLPQQSHTKYLAAHGKYLSLSTDLGFNLDKENMVTSYSIQKSHTKLMTQINIENLWILILFQPIKCNVHILNFIMTLT